jgi:hypothetical protein
MVPTSSYEEIPEVTWPANAWLGSIVDSQPSADFAYEVVEDSECEIRFVICDLHKESIVFDKLSEFHWIIIKNSSKVQPPWQRVESVLEQAAADDLWIYLMPNITVRPREYPKLQEEGAVSQMQDVVIPESVKQTV